MTSDTGTSRRARQVGDAYEFIDLQRRYVLDSVIRHLRAGPARLGQTNERSM
jgi:hypothetical protein